MDDLLASLAYILGEGQSAHELALWQFATRSVVLYLGALALVRLGKSRMLSQYSPVDIILGIILGSVVGRGIMGGTSVPGALAATASLVLLHWVLTLVTSQNHWIGKLLKGNYVLLVSDGKIHWDNLRRSHMSERDLQEQLRSNANLDDLQQVKAAYKERSGHVGIVKQPATASIQDIEVKDGVQTVRIVISASS